MTSSSNSSSLQTLNAATKVALPVLSLLGLWGTWGLGYRTGFLEMIKERLTASKKLLPSAEKPLKLHYTRIPPVDKLIQRLNVFLWPAIDGRWPGLALVAFEFSGQFSGTWMVAGLEGLRRGNVGKLLTYTTIVGTLSQVITYGTIVPLYMFLHFISSPTTLAPGVQHETDAATDLLVDPMEALAWPIAFTLSYLIPTLLVALPTPTYTSFTTRQNIMAFWELYPVPFKIFQMLLARYLSSLLQYTRSGLGSSDKKAESLKYLRYIYAFSALVGGITHIITLTLTFSAAFFPSIFTPAAAASLAPAGVLGLHSPFDSTRVKDMGYGLWHFLQWNMNVSNVAPVLWALVQYRNACEGRVKWEGWWTVLAKVVGTYLVGGAAVATAGLMYLRDELVLGGGDGKPGERKKRL